MHRVGLREWTLTACLAAATLGFLGGCGGGGEASNESAASNAGAGNDEANITANLAKLPDEDRALAEKQKVCPISGNPLGDMGTPYKVMLKDKPVLLCCDGCEEKAKADPDATLAKVEELVAANSGADAP